MSWEKELNENITMAEDLLPHLNLSKQEIAEIRKILNRFPMSVTPYYLSLIDFSDENDPIRKMAIPSLAEEDLSGSFDTSGEAESTVHSGVQHKYEHTLLVLSTSRCAMYCRHCFRKRMVGTQSGETSEKIDDICRYLKEHPEISNVLISGGDALLNSNEYLEALLSHLTQHPTLDAIRIASRTPVVFPQRIYEDAQLISMLERYNKKKSLTLVTQYNHERELSDLSLKSVRFLQEIGISVKNQTVLLRGVNDSEHALTNLLKKLVSAGITPYYVFQCRPVCGVKNHFQVPLAEGYRVVQAAKNNQSGLGKMFRYCLSHHSGKLEILGMHQNEMLLQYHEARSPKNLGRIVSVQLEPNQTWPTDRNLP